MLLPLDALTEQVQLRILTVHLKLLALYQGRTSLCVVFHIVVVVFGPPGRYLTLMGR